eukprot:gene9451-3029_t
MDRLRQYGWTVLVMDQRNKYSNVAGCCYRLTLQNICIQDLL